MNALANHEGKQYMNSEATFNRPLFGFIRLNGRLEAMLVSELRQQTSFEPYHAEAQRDRASDAHRRLTTLTFSVTA